MGTTKKLFAKDTILVSLRKQWTKGYNVNRVIEKGIIVKVALDMLQDSSIVHVFLDYEHEWRCLEFGFEVSGFRLAYQSEIAKNKKESDQIERILILRDLDEWYRDNEEY